MYYLYIIKSTVKDWRYIGTTDNKEKRLKEHIIEVKQNRQKLMHRLSRYIVRLFRIKPPRVREKYT